MWSATRDASARRRAGTLRQALLALVFAASLGSIADQAHGATVCGDVDLDDQFSGADLAILRDHLAGLPTPGLDLSSGPSAVRCDVNSSVSCDVVEMVLYARFLAGTAGAPFGLCANLTLPPGVPADPGPFSVSGTVLAAAAQFVDSDVNDVFTTPVSNNGLLNAQPVPSPATVGGYVNEPFFGPTGNLFLSGDTVDGFRVSLAQGQVVTLVLGDSPAVADLDLILFDSNDPLNQVEVDSSLGLGAVETVVAPFSGQFDIVVVPVGSASTYVLSIGQALPTASADSLHLSDEFVPGQVIVQPAAAAMAGAASAAAPAASFDALYGLHGVAGRAGSGLLLELGRSESELRASFQTLGVSAERAALHAHLPGLDAETRRKLDTILAVKALRRRGDVETADLNYIRRPSLTPNDEFFGFQWHYPLINAPAAWDITTGDLNVIVAVVDTGVILSHPDLAGQLIAGFDFISDPSRARDGDGIDPNPNDEGDLAFGNASSFHGTHVAGTVGARTDNLTGVAGVAWNVSIMPLRALGVQGGTSFDIQQAVLYAARLPNASATLPPTRADVVNLSLGGGGSSASEQAVYGQARDAGVIIIAAAGNSNSSIPSFPASYPGVVSVSAVDLLKAKAPYSNFGGGIDVAGPGGDSSVDLNGDGFVDGVLSPLADDSGPTLLFNYTFYQGTSMASPHVAGVAALMKARNRALSPDQFDALLAAGSITEDLGVAGRDDIFGHGLIDARKAVVEAGGPPPPATPLLSLNPTGLNFGAALTNTSLQVSNAGGGSLSVTSISNDSGGWLAVTPAGVDADGLGSYTVSVDRTGLVAATYGATITVTSSAGVSGVSVVMSVGDGGLPTESDAGFHFVILIDPVTGATVDQVEVAASGGIYPFAFAAVPEGSYQLLAGTDLDNDGFICDGGEACAGFPTVNLISPIVVEQNISGLSFVTSFTATVSSSAATRSGPDFPGFRLLRPKARPKQVPKVD